MSKRHFHVIMGVLLVLIMSVSGCTTKPEIAEQPLPPPEPVSPPEQSPNDPGDSAEPGHQTHAGAFRGTDFLSGEAIEFKPGESDRPAIISFFSPG